MPKKRKAEANGLDEMDRELYGTFRTAANSISALYTSSLSLQKRAFNGGARHATERLLTWALAHGEGTLSASDLAAALQAELVVLEGEDAAMRAAAEGVTEGVQQHHHPGGSRHHVHHHNRAANEREKSGHDVRRAQLATIDFNATTHGGVDQMGLGQKLGQAFSTVGGPVTTRSGHNTGDGFHHSHHTHGPNPEHSMDDDE
jgi:hypothetical protein